MPGRLYDLNDCKYGNEEKLRETIEKFHRVGVRCIADIVVNHRCGEEQDERGEWVIFEGGTPDDALDWGPWAIVGDDYPYGNGTGEHIYYHIFTTLGDKIPPENIRGCHLHLLYSSESKFSFA